MDKFLFLLPYIFSFAISLGVLGHTWRFRNVRGAKTYAWYVAGQSLWVLGYILELVSPGLDGKVFWDQFQWIAGLLITIAFPVFAIQYTETKIRRPRLLFGLSLIVPLLFAVIVVTDNWHHFIYLDPYLDQSVTFSDLKYEFTWLVYVYAAYGYLVTLTGLGILLRRLIKPHRLYKRQILTVIIGFTIPILFTMLTTAGVKFRPFRDVSPFTFAIGNLIVAWGLFRYRLFDIVPIARDLLVDNMEDLVVVLDKQDRIVDINPSALKAINQKASQVIGRPAETIFRAWPELITRFFEPENVKSEIALGSKNELNHFEIKSTVLYNRNDRIIGRVFVARDITERKELQKGLEKLNQELEERVAKRTEQYRASESQFRELWDATVEGIVIHDEGKIVELNNAMCNLFDITRKQAIGKSLLEFALDETKENVWRQIFSETEEPFETPALTLTGNKLLLEVFPKQINFLGKPMRMAAVRDITERKQTEEALLESEERFSTLADASFEGIVISDKGRVIDCNQQLATMLGYEQSEMIGLEVSKFVAPESLDVVLEHIKSGSEEPYEHLSLRNDGTTFPVEIRAKSIPFKGRQVRVTAIRDITERKQAEKSLMEAYDTTLEGWAKALELRDKETEDHSRRVTELTVTLAEAMGIEGQELTDIRRGAILHDIGKMGIPDEILLKRGPLTITERQVVEQHPTRGYELLANSSYLEKALDIPYCHHEHWDGKGYPRGLQGEDIPLAARIFTVVDVWDALLSDRPYSKAWPKEKAIQHLKDETGKIFDPNCVSVFLELVEQGKI